VLLQNSLSNNRCQLSELFNKIVVYINQVQKICYSTDPLDSQQWASYRLAGKSSCHVKLIKTWDFLKKKHFSNENYNLYFKAALVCLLIFAGIYMFLLSPQLKKNIKECVIV